MLDSSFIFQICEIDDHNEDHNKLIHIFCNSAILWVIERGRRESIRRRGNLKKLRPPQFIFNLCYDIFSLDVIQSLLFWIHKIKSLSSLALFLCCFFGGCTLLENRNHHQKNIVAKYESHIFMDLRVTRSYLNFEI